jgi:DNA polymerase III delta prime subunit
MKFIILDEVDYMTKNAQQALRYLIQQYNPDIRFCLICNYISRIEYALQNEFIRLRFCNLPSKAIFTFLQNIVKKEKIQISTQQLKSIQNIFKSDIRSMINFLQSNHHNSQSFCQMITNDFWETMTSNLNKYNDKEIYKILEKGCVLYNIEMPHMIKNFIDYFIKNKTELLTEKILTFFTYIVHNISSKKEYIVYFFLREFRAVNKL